MRNHVNIFVIFMLLLASLALVAAGCSDSVTSEPITDGDTDTPTDGDAEPDGDAVVDGDETIDGDTVVDGDTSVDGDVQPDGDTTVDGDAIVDGDTVVDGDEPGDTTPPRLRSVQAEITGEFGSPVDLDAGDEVRVLPGDAQTVFTVMASDNIDAPEDLTVQVIRTDDDNQALPNVDSLFSNNLWRITVALTPGVTVGVVVSDSAGNQTFSEHALRIPSASQAFIGEWEYRFFAKSGDNHNITHRRHLNVFSDGSWASDWSNADNSFGGAYAISDGTLTLDESWHLNENGRPDDENTDTIEERIESAFHMDAIYFSPTPFTLTAGTGSALVGTWQTSYTRFLPNGDGDLVQDTTVTITLTLDANGSYAIQVQRAGAGRMPEIASSESGTWVIEENKEYMDDYGDFLHFTATSRDGATLDPAEDRWELHVVKADKLLISPAIRQSEPLEEPQTN